MSEGIWTLMLSNDKEIQRRTVLKGAAWSVPVIAVAAASPAHGATVSGVNQNLDVGVYGYCDNHYDIEDLRTLLGGVSLVGLPVGFGLTQLVDVVKAALALIGVKSGAKRGFLITAKGDVLKKGSKFPLSTAPGTLIDLNLQLPVVAAIDAQAAFVANVNGNNVVVTTDQDLAANNSLDLKLTENFLDVDALTTTTLQFSPATDKTMSPEDPDMGSFTTIVGTPVNIGKLDIAGVLVDVLGSFLGGLVAAVLGSTLLPRLKDLTLRIQLCNGEPDIKQ